MSGHSTPQQGISGAGRGWEWCLCQQGFLEPLETWNLTLEILHKLDLTFTLEINSHSISAQAPSPHSHALSIRRTPKLTTNPLPQIKTRGGAAAAFRKALKWPPSLPAHLVASVAELQGLTQELSKEGITWNFGSVTFPLPDLSFLEFQLSGKMHVASGLVFLLAA